MASIDDVIRLLEAARDTDSKAEKKTSSTNAAKLLSKIHSSKAPRKASAYSKKYAKAFKSIAPKHKKKAGGWKKDGYKKAVKAAHAKAKRMK